MDRRTSGEDSWLDLDSVGSYIRLLQWKDSAGAQVGPQCGFRMALPIKPGFPQAMGEVHGLQRRLPGHVQPATHENPPFRTRGLERGWLELHVRRPAHFRANPALKAVHTMHYGRYREG